MRTELRPELPPLPKWMRSLKVDSRGYPVPWFVVWLDERDQPVRPGEGTPDFRVVFPGATEQAVKHRRCWICGGPLGRYEAFVLGPMCAVNRTSAEPPSHRDCADYSARACPFLARPHARRREQGMPDEMKQAEVPGIMLKRNPGVALVWITEHGRWRRFRAHNGLLFDIGEPVETRWYAEGRPATREEVETSIESGLPSLRELAEQDGEAALLELDACVERAKRFLPEIATPVRG
jgi:hypothetical protein